MILSGLKPETVMDVCARAISFWSYQISHEQKFQELKLHEYEDQYQYLESNAEKMACNLKIENDQLNEKIKLLQHQLGEEQEANMRKSEQLHEKGKLCKKLQSICDGLKRRQSIEPTSPTLSSKPETRVPLSEKPNSGWNFMNNNSAKGQIQFDRANRFGFHK